MRGFPARPVLALALAAALLCGCASRPHGACGGDERRRTAELIFGRAVKGGPDVSDAEFADFLDKEVSARFPLGLTVVDAQGRWQSPTGQSVREPSKVVLIVLPGAPDDRSKLNAVRAAYKARFRQDSVLQVTSHTCVSF